MEQTKINKSIFNIKNNLPMEKPKKRKIIKYLPFNECLLEQTIF